MKYTIGSGIEINDSGSRKLASKWTTVQYRYLGVAVVYHINDFLESHQNLLAGPVDLNKENCRYFYSYLAFRIFNPLFPLFYPYRVRT
jgi:hypothetical protein